MIKVELTSEQVRELRNAYMDELDKLQKRSEEVLALLRAIGQGTDVNDPQTKPQKVESPSKETQQEVSTEKQAVATKPVPAEKRPGWSDYILKKLSESKKPLTKVDIYKAYQKEFNYSFPDPAAAKNTLGQTLHYLRNVKKMIDSEPREGKRGHTYTLVDNTDLPVKKKIKAPKPEKELSKENPLVKEENEKWSRFPVDALTEAGRPLMRDDFVRMAFPHFNILPKHRISTRGKVSKALRKATKDEGSVVKVKIPDHVGTFYALSEWVDANNNLKPELV
ncbi:MAG: hypothetical protein KDC05_15565 [Bacteroidales bacterium]|nr:hypothetical protein [Bacteroidales bacterium]